MANKPSGYLIDDAAKRVLYFLSTHEGGHPVSKLSYEISVETGRALSSIVRRITRLIEQGFVEERATNMMRLISITKKGKKVAEKLREIDQIMEGVEDEDKTGV